MRSPSHRVDEERANLSPKVERSCRLSVEMVDHMPLRGSAFQGNRCCDETQTLGKYAQVRVLTGSEYKNIMSLHECSTFKESEEECADCPRAMSCGQFIVAATVTTKRGERSVYWLQQV